MRNPRLRRFPAAFALGLFAQVGLFAHLLTPAFREKHRRRRGGGGDRTRHGLRRPRPDPVRLADREPRPPPGRRAQFRHAGVRHRPSRALERGRAAALRLRPVRARGRQPGVAAAPDHSARISAGRCRPRRRADRRDQPGDLRLRAGGARRAARSRRHLHGGVRDRRGDPARRGRDGRRLAPPRGDAPSAHGGEGRHHWG